MAAIINLPSSPKISAVTDKPPLAQTDSSEQSKGFSQALSEQMEKKQAPQAASKNVDATPGDSGNSFDNHKVSVSPEGPGKGADSRVDSDVGSTEETPEGNSIAVEPEVIQLQHPGLPELLALRMASAEPGARGGKELQLDGNTEGGKELPLMASVTGKAATIDELLLARSTQNTDADEAGMTANNVGLDEQAVLDLQQRAQQQLRGDVPVDALKQTLHGVENALQSLNRVQGEAGDTKGLEQARDALMARLQGLQGQNNQSGSGNNSEQQANSSKLPFMQNVNSEEAGKLSELSKLTRVAFQEMLVQQQPANAQGQAIGLNNLLAGSAISMNSLSAMLTPTSGGNPLLNYAASSSSLNLPVNHPGWGQAVGERLQWMVKQDIQQAELKLNPRNMGPIEIKIAMNQEQATVTFVANHAMTREALDAAVPRLREMFGESGLNLVDVNVSQHPDTSGQRASDRGEGSGNGAAAGLAEATDEADLSDDALAMAASQGEHWYGSNSVLDAYA